MPRTLSAGLAAHLAGDAHTLCTMLRLDMRDGTSLGVTDHDRDLSFDLGDGALTYSTATGILPSDVVLSAGMDADNFEVTGPISDVVTRTAVLGGRFTSARARLFMVNWADLTQGPARLFMGKVSESRVIGSRFVFEIRGPQDAFNQPIGRVLSPTCTHDFGDARCRITKSAYTATITAVASPFSFATDLLGEHPNNFFTMGSVEFLTGEMAGIAPVEVFAYHGATGAVELYVPLPDAPQVGDTINLFRGCSKLRKSDDATIPTCLSYENVINFGGHPEVPGTMNYMTYPIAGQGGG